jgi:ATP-dependent Clp protease, protease subunit
MILTLAFLSMLTGVSNDFVSTSPMVKDNVVVEPVTVIISGSINDSAADTFTKDMERAMKTGQTIIPIVISSYGGNVHAMLQMFDVINKAKAAKFKIATIATGKAMSAGAALLTCGTEGMRFATTNATIMIHEVSSETGGKIGEIKVDAAETDRLNKLLLETMSLNIGKDRNYFANIIHTKGHADWFLTAHDAVQYGVVNKIGSPNLKIKINVELSIE